MSGDFKYGYQGRTVRHTDGRTGKIVLEDGFAHQLDLHIRCDDGSKSVVRLDCRYGDKGEEGWCYYRENFDGSRSAWLPLGEQGGPLQYVEQAEAGSSAKDAPQEMLRQRVC